MRWIIVFISANVGYYVVAYPSCTWFWPDSNLCGIYGLPAAVVSAAVAIWFTSPRRRRT